MLQIYLLMCIDIDIKVIIKTHDPINSYEWDKIAYPQALEVNIFCVKSVNYHSRSALSS